MKILKWLKQKFNKTQTVAEEKNIDPFADIRKEKTTEVVVKPPAKRTTKKRTTKSQPKGKKNG